MEQERYRAQVSRVIDGDSLTVWAGDLQEEVRLYGIDAPEMEQPGADEARNALWRMLGRQTFWLEPQHTDPYGRTVGIIYHQERHHRDSVNLRMVREGQAYAYTRFGGMELGIHQAEADARQGRRGSWRDSSRGGGRPWEYRRRNAREKHKGGGCLSWILTALVIATVVLAAIFMIPPQP